MNAISALYQSNGFTNVKVTPEVREVATSPKKERDLAVTYQIDEGVQQKVGVYRINGVSPAQLADLQPRLSLESGQPYSPTNLASDRDAILGYFLDHGYDHAKVTIQQKPASARPQPRSMSPSTSPLAIRSSCATSLSPASTTPVPASSIVNPRQAGPAPRSGKAPRFPAPALQPHSLQSGHHRRSEPGRR